MRCTLMVLAYKLIVLSNESCDRRRASITYTRGTITPFRSQAVAGVFTTTSLTLTVAADLSRSARDVRVEDAQKYAEDPSSEDIPRLQCTAKRCLWMD